MSTLTTAPDFPIDMQDEYRVINSEDEEEEEISEHLLWILVLMRKFSKLQTSKDYP